MRVAVATLIALVASGCAAPRLDARAVPPGGFDALIVPGCPTEEDGAPSRCQKGRALWAAILWERGWARNLIVSGAAVHTPWVEAEVLAALVHALGVPAERIHLEPNALHTDENMYDALQIARARGWRTVAVASNGGHAAGGCTMVRGWGQPCTALPVDRAAVEARAASAPHLAQVRTRPVARWVPLVERERRITAETGRRRPPSYLLYPMAGLMRLNGEVWIPRAPAKPPLVTWADVVSRERP